MKENIKGKRIYGAWAGSPKGTPEDTTLCIEEVWSQGRCMVAHQCGKKRGYGKDGLYCKVHDPEYVKAKQQAEQAKWAKETAESTAKYKLQSTAVNACKAINPDNPQAVAGGITALYEALKAAVNPTLTTREMREIALKALAKVER